MPDDRPLAVFDIDGVLADVRHRLRHVQRRPKDWDAFFGAAKDDPPHEEGVGLARRYAQDHELVFLTGRPERCRRDTLDWLEAQGLGGYRLIMRPARDRRPAVVVKRQLLERLARDRDVAIVVDDDQLVVSALTEAGWPVLHADWERRGPGRDQALFEAQEVEGRS